MKLGHRALKGMFVGYAKKSKAYRILYSNSNVIMESRDVEFIENKFQRDSHTLDEPNTSQVDKEPTNIERANISSSNKRNQIDSSIEVRRSTRARKEKNLSSEFISS